MYSIHSEPITDTKKWDGNGTLVAHTIQKLATDTNYFTPVSHATNDRAYGIISEITALKEAVDGQALPMKLVIFGPTRCKVGSGGVTAGKMIKMDANGCVEDATPTYGTEMIVGWSFETKANGEFAEIFFCKFLAAGA